MKIENFKNSIFLSYYLFYTSDMSLSPAVRSLQEKSCAITALEDLHPNGKLLLKQLEAINLQEHYKN